jgi:deoxyadenosine/deoxycytidine kinase
MYYRVQEALSEKITPPDLMVYLRASTETLMQRIAMRDRPYERQMDPAYIEMLVQSYDQFFITNPPSMPGLVIECDHLDFVRNPQDLHLIDTRIRQALQLAPYQPELPLDGK